MIIIDGANKIFGRVASRVAKLALNGNEVVVINVEKMVMTGDPQRIIEKYSHRRSLQNKANPEKSPKWPRLPHFFAKKLIKGMLPRKKARGREALKRIKFYVGNPLGLEANQSMEEFDISKSNAKRYLSIGDICRYFGWRGY